MENDPSMMNAQAGQGADPFQDMLTSNPALMQQISQMPEEEQAAFMQQLFQDYSGQGAMLDEQAAQADALRNKQGSRGMHTGSGFVAANPLSGVGTLMNQYSGNRDHKKAMEGKKALSDSQTAGNTQLADMLRKQQAAEDLANQSEAAM